MRRKINMINENLYKGTTTNYNTLEEKEVKSVVLYAHSDNVLYHDKAHKVKVAKTDLLTLLQGRVIIESSDTFFIPVRYKANVAGHIDVFCAESASAEKTFKSDVK